MRYAPYSTVAAQVRLHTCTDCIQRAFSYARGAWRRRRRAGRGPPLSIQHLQTPDSATHVSDSDGVTCETSLESRLCSLYDVSR